MSEFLSNFAAEHAVLPLDVALYRACKDRHGSKAAIAEINGFNSMVFSKCVDINNEQYHLKPEHIEAIVSYTKDIRILESLATAHGNVVFYEIPERIANSKNFNFLANIGSVSKKVGVLFDGLSGSLEDDVITDIELAMLEKHCQQLIGAISQLKNLAREKSEADRKEQI